MSAPTRTPRSSWVEEGAPALAAGGPDAVRVELLARALGVTRGGFYWHFPDRSALLAEMLRTRQRTTTHQRAETLEPEGSHPRAQPPRLTPPTSTTLPP